MSSTQGEPPPNPPSPLIIADIKAEMKFSAGMTFAGRAIANFSCQHLMAAATFRDHATALEDANRDQPFGPFYNQIRSSVSGCIMSATASLEGLINELFLAEGSRLREALGSDFECRFWGSKGIESKPILAKYERALELLGEARIDRNSIDYQNMDWLIGLRNALVHFKPIWDVEHQRNMDLRETFMDRFALSPFMHGNEDFVASKCMSAGCAKWAVQSVLSFLRAFDGCAGIDAGKMAGFWFLERSSRDG